MGKGITNRAYRKELVKRYIAMEKPPPLKPWLREHHIIKQTFDKVHGELIADEKTRTLTVIKEEEQAKREGADRLGDMLNAAGEDEDKWEMMEAAIYKRGLDGNVKAQELYAKLKKKLKEEVNLTVGLSADEITRRNLAATRELREGGYGKPQVKKGDNNEKENGITYVG